MFHPSARVAQTMCGTDSAKVLNASSLSCNAISMRLREVISLTTSVSDCCERVTASFDRFIEAAFFSARDFGDSDFDVSDEDLLAAFVGLEGGTFIFFIFFGRGV